MNSSSLAMPIPMSALADEFLQPLGRRQGRPGWARPPAELERAGDLQREEWVVGGCLVHSAELWTRQHDAEPLP